MLVTKFAQFGYTVLVTLFTDVTNAAEIRKELLAANADYEYAFVDAATVVSLEQLLAAVYRAVNDTANGFLRTRNIHAEAVFCLSPNNNIMDGLRRFGIADDTSSLYAIKLIKDGSVEQYYSFLTQHVHGTEIQTIESESPYTDLALVKKVCPQAPRTSEASNGSGQSPAAGGNNLT